MILPVRLSDSGRTLIAYIVMLLCILCATLSCASTTYSYLQHLYLDDINRLVRGYTASDVLLTIATIDSLSGTIFVIGFYISFRMSSDADRKSGISWLIGYIVVLIVAVAGLLFCLIYCYVGVQRPILERSLQVCLLSGY